MKKYKVAIIGCGTIFSSHADALENCSNTEIKAVVDIDAKKAVNAAQKYGCNHYCDYRDMLNDKEIDAVHICTPHYLHAQMAIDAMRANKHVLTEKPMAISVRDCEEMIRVSEKTGKQLGVCFQNRYNTTSLYMKNMIQSGNPGKILVAKASVTWFRDKDYYENSSWRGTWSKEGGGVLINQAIHTLDLLQWFMGDAKKVKGNADTRFLKKIIEVEDTAEATIQFENGSHAFFFATNGYDSRAPILLEIISENAVLTLSDDLTVHFKNGETEVISDSNKKAGEKFYYGTGHMALIEDFYNCLLQKKPFAVSGDQGIKAIKIIQALYESSNTHEWVEI